MSAPVRPRRHALRLLLVALVATVGLLGLLPASADVPVSRGMIRFEGGGWGHGVGMSQYGAQNRARAGHDHEEILDFYYPGAELEEVASPDDLAVHVVSGGAVTLTTAGPVVVVDAGGATVLEVSGATTITINRTKAGAFTVKEGGGGDVCGGECGDGPLRVRYPQGENPVRVDIIGQRSIGLTGNRYEYGEIVIYDRPYEAGTLWVLVEGLTMEQYLYGLSEMPASWSTEALRAQAVAGRTYATNRINARRASSSWTVPWDLYSTVNDQVYRGATSVDSRWVAAVEATTDRILRYDGRPIEAFYTSSNGGSTEDSGYVFSVSLPYLPARADSFDAAGNPYGSWVRDVTGTELETWLAASNHGSVGIVTGIEITGPVGASGRNDRATIVITGSDRSLSMSERAFRSLVNNGLQSRRNVGFGYQLMSTKYTVDIPGSEPIGALESVTRRGDDVRVVGWVFDPDDTRAVPIDIRVDDDVVADEVADVSRFDVNAAYANGRNRGFEATFDVSGGAHQVCVYAANLGGGPAMLVGCRRV